MRLLFLAESFPTSTKIDLTGGVESGDWFTAVELAKRHEVTVLTAARKNTPNQEIIRHIKVIRIGLPVTPDQRESISVRLAFFRACLRVIPTLDYEVIHASNAFTQFIVTRLNHQLNTPIIARIPDIYLGSWIKNTNLVIGLSGELLEGQVIKTPWSAVIAWSETTKQKLMTAGIQSKVIRVIPGGIDLKTIRATKAIKKKNPTIISISRLVNYKHLDIVIRAVDYLKHRHPDLKLEIIGMGPAQSKLERLVISLGLSQKVSFIGYLDNHRQLIKHLKAATIFSLPSSVEGFGLATLEACACGLPYVNLDVPATREITLNGKGGFLIATPDEKLVAIQIDRLLTDKRLYNTKVHEGLNLVTRYDWEKSSAQTEKLFEKVIRRAATPSRHRHGRLVSLG